MFSARNWRTPTKLIDLVRLPADENAKIYLGFGKIDTYTPPSAGWPHFRFPECHLSLAITCLLSPFAYLLRPLLAESGQVGLGQILGNHDWMNMAIGVESEEPRLGNCGYL